MLKKNVFIGNVYCIKDGMSKIYLDSCPLIEVSDGCFVNLELISDFKDYLYLYKALLTKNFNTRFIIRDKIANEGLFVDRNSLIPFYIENSNKKRNVKRIKEDVIVDSRVPGGIEIMSDGTVIRFTYKRTLNK